MKENPVDEMMFRHLEDELVSDINIMDVCKCAYVKYFSEKQNLTDVAKRISKECIEYLEKKNIIFDFFKMYDKWFNISGNISDKTTIIYRTEPRDKIMINYYLETGNLTAKEYITEEMKCCFKGMYTKSFTLFYGEKLKYYISEIVDDEMKFTESRDYQLDDRGVEMSTTRYGLLNNILVCRELKEENIVNHLARKYYINNELAKKLFS